MRSLVATKSGNDALLRRTLEEAERRRVNPTASALPPDAEANELLDRTRAATLGAAAAMPDFIVKQLIKRSSAYGTTNNWIPQDNLTIAVGYRANAGEQYKVLAVNGMPLGPGSKTNARLQQRRGAGCDFKRRRIHFRGRGCFQAGVKNRFQAGRYRYDSGSPHVGF